MIFSEYTALTQDGIGLHGLGGSLLSLEPRWHEPKWLEPKWLRTPSFSFLVAARTRRAAEVVEPAAVGRVADSSPCCGGAAVVIPPPR